jgi:hypothetical protein
MTVFGFKPILCQLFTILCWGLSCTKPVSYLKLHYASNISYTVIYLINPVSWKPLTKSVWFMSMKDYRGSKGPNTYLFSPSIIDYLCPTSTTWSTVINQHHWTECLRNLHFLSTLAHSLDVHYNNIKDKEEIWYGMDSIENYTSTCLPSRCLATIGGYTGTLTDFPLIRHGSYRKRRIQQFPHCCEYLLPRERVYWAVA